MKAEDHSIIGKETVMKKILRAAAAVLSAAVIFSLTACGGTNTDTASDDSSAAETTATAEKPADAEILNFVPPAEGEEIAVITVKDMGEIKIKLFADEMPKAVENFKGLANMNYYDELIFHRVIPSFMIQGGDPRGNGTGGNSMWGGSFDGGVSDKLFHFSGAVAYANSGSTSTDGSQFYIVDTDDAEVYYGGMSSFEEMGLNLPENVEQMYLEKGGTPHLDGSYTVFGQVFEGMDIVREIAKAETDENDKPLKQISMESVRIVEYKAE